MTLPQQPAFALAPSTADLVAAEKAQIAAGTATACGYTCADHGGHVCERVTTHDGPHVATQPGGDLIQWHPPCLTADEVAAQVAAQQQAAAAAREAATHNIFQTLDPALLVQLLVQGGYVAPTVAPTTPAPTP